MSTTKHTPGPNKATPVLEELGIMLEGAEALFDMEADEDHPNPIDDGIELVREAVELMDEVKADHAAMLAALVEANEALQGMRNYVDGAKGEIADPLGTMDEAMENLTALIAKHTQS